MAIDEIKDTTKDLTDHVIDYAETYYKFAVLNLTEKATNIASATISAISILTLGMFVILFLGLALAWWLGDVLNSRSAGFLIVGGFFLVIVVLIVALSKKIIFPYFRDSIIRKLYV